MVFANGYTMAMAWNLDGLGHVYIAVATVWTAVLIAGIIFLIKNRKLPFIRIRNVPLCVSAVLILHVYWTLCLAAYVLQGYFPCATEFWIMSIYLPLGIALFHAANTQLLHVAGLQKHFTEMHNTSAETGHQTRKIRGWRRYVAFVYAQNKVKKTMGYIAYAMIFQFFTAMLIFLASRKFHSNFGLVGSVITDSGCTSLEQKYNVNDCEAAQKIECRRGWEWILSILWQFFWSWMYAPFLLWKLRDVQDVHGWRKQTVICCIAGLPASPMWLCALYIPQMGKVNYYFVPPLWFAPSIFLIEAFLIFVPCWQVVKNRRLKRETLDIIAEWEHKNTGSSIDSDTTRAVSRVSQKSSCMSSVSSRRGEMYTMTALESALRTNPQPLLLFAALKDFSGENISFLTSVLDWERDWSPSSPSRTGLLRRPNHDGFSDLNVQREQFKKAIDIYASFVSLEHSHFPINLSYGHFRELEACFENATSVLYGHSQDEVNAATPFNKYWDSSQSTELDSQHGKDGMSVTSTAIGSGSTDNILSPFEKGLKHQRVVETFKMTDMSHKLPENIPIPANFGLHIFDNAKESIKYMVLTNTWPKFVNAGYASVRKTSAWDKVKSELLHRGCTTQKV